MAEAVTPPDALERREPDTAPAPHEQPNAPYLEAVVAYAFRGPARYHVPGHKGGPGADPGVRKAIGVDALAADVPQDIHGIDLGPSAGGRDPMREARCPVHFFHCKGLL